MEEFGVSKINKESRTIWLPINSQIREDVVFKVDISDLQLQDKIWQWGTWTVQIVENIFSVLQVGMRPYEFPNNVHVSVTFELNLNLRVIERQVYSVLDWLGDIGGLGEAAFFLGTMFLAIFHYGKFDSMMIRELFQVKKVQ